MKQLTKKYISRRYYPPPWEKGKPALHRLLSGLSTKALAAKLNMPDLLITNLDIQSMLTRAPIAFSINRKRGNKMRSKYVHVISRGTS